MIEHKTVEELALGDIIIDNGEELEVCNIVRLRKKTQLVLKAYDIMGDVVWSEPLVMNNKNIVKVMQ